MLTRAKTRAWSDSARYRSVKKLLSISILARLPFALTLFCVEGRVIAKIILHKMAYPKKIT
ncbi:MAG TPA: hypothetical protein VL727_28240 [Puia sp.]|nr:hypothetical protein [Puia sp.]